MFAAPRLHRLPNYVIGLVLAWVSLAAFAHEIRPAYLEITENPGGDVHVLWKQPITGKLSLPLAPTLSSGWLKEEAAQQNFTDTFLLRQWDIAAAPEALHGQRLVIGGLEKSITDVLVRIRFADGATITKLVKPELPGFDIQHPGQSSLAATEYFELGVTHIWTGIDHLLYIFGLMLLVRNFRTLVKTITSFTVAHSITLAGAALHLVEVNSAQIEVVIAFSIVCVAVEVVNLYRGHPGLAARYPWLIAFSFGLLHGFGFASALAEVGLPKDAIPEALFLFNVGIEAGQLAYVVSMTALLAVLKWLWPRIEPWVPRLAPYAIGSLASFWCFERGAQLF